MTEQDVVAWFRDMHAHLGEAEIVLSHSDFELVKTEGLFPGRCVWWLFLTTGDFGPDSRLPDLTGPLPFPQSVPIMALMLALYMGCKKIYLLGTEHDQFLTGRYTHFYERSPVSGKDLSVDSQGRVLSSRYDEFNALARLWRQYRWLRRCAEEAGATIYNATLGGALDEFERVDFNTLKLAADQNDVQSVMAGRE
jgi:hypothetical protein